MSKNFHFLDIPDEAASDPEAPYAVLPVPYERGVSYGGGTAQGPPAVIKASHETEDFDEELQVATNLRVQTLEPPGFEGLEDREALNSIEKAAAEVLKAHRFLLSLGGEHTITAPLAKAARDVHGDVLIVNVDSHLDLRDRYLDNPLSHACVMRRIREWGIPTVHVGVRSAAEIEHRFIEENNIPVYWAWEMFSRSGKDRLSSLFGTITGKTVYLSVDIDAFDPSLVPGTGTPEPGGFFWYDMLSLIKAVVQYSHVVAADIVEVSPVPGTQVSEFVAARLGAKILTYHKFRDKLKEL